MISNECHADFSLCCNATKTGITLQTDLRAWVSALGFSKAICTQKVNSVRTLYCSLEPNKNGILVVHVRHLLDKGTPHDYYYIIPFRWEEEKVFVGLKELWTPPFADRIPVLESGHLKVMIDGKVYSTRPGSGCVSDMNILCQYLVGEASADDVKAAATAHVEEVNVREELAVLSAEHARILEVNNEQAERIDYLQKELELREHSLDVGTNAIEALIAEKERLDEGLQYAISAADFFPWSPLVKTPIKDIIKACFRDMKKERQKTRKDMLISAKKIGKEVFLK